MPTDPYALRVKDVMSRDVVTIYPTDSVHDALNLMAENKVAALPVIDSHDRCIGMLSTSDLVDVTRDVDADLTELGESSEVSRHWLIEKLSDGLGHQTVVDVMSENVATIGQEDKVVDAGREMLRHRVHRLPVLDESKRLKGIVSTTDVLRAFVDGSQ